MPSFRVEDLNIEGSYYIGTVLSAIIYGIYLGIYCLSIRALLANTSTTRLHRNFYISFSSLMLLLNTATFVGLPYVGQMMWIVTRNSYPGGLPAYIRAATGIPIELLSNITQTLATMLNDSLLVYRCYVVFGSRVYIIILPVLSSLTALAIGGILIPLSLHPELQKLDALNAVALVLNTVTNIMVTAMVSIKILSVSRTLNKYMDSTPAHVRSYTNIVAMLIESAAPCAALGIAACIGWFMSTGKSTFSLDNEAIILVWGMSMALFPQLITYRIAHGSAWTEKTSQELTQPTSSLAFAPGGINAAISGSESNALVYHQTDEGSIV